MKKNVASKLKHCSEKHGLPEAFRNRIEREINKAGKGTTEKRETALALSTLKNMLQEASDQKADIQKQIKAAAPDVVSKTTESKPAKVSSRKSTNFKVDETYFVEVGDETIGVTFDRAFTGVWYVLSDDAPYDLGFPLPEATNAKEAIAQAAEMATSDSKKELTHFAKGTKENKITRLSAEESLENTATSNEFDDIDDTESVDLVEKLASAIPALKGAKSVWPKSSRLAGIARAIETLFSVKVVFYDAKEDVPINGLFAAVLNNNAIFVKADDSANPYRVIGHELLHLLDSRNKPLYKKFKSLMVDYMVNTSEYADRLNSKKLTGTTDVNQVLSAAEVTDEILADFVGEMLTDPSFWRSLERFSPQNKGLIEYVANLTFEIFDKVMEHLKKVLGDSIAKKHFSDIEAAKETLARYLGKTINDKSSPNRDNPNVTQFSIRDGDQNGRDRSVKKNAGAPPWIKNYGDRLKLQNWMRKLTREGQEYRHWYEESGQAVLKYFDGDIDDARKFIQLLAIYSPQAAVPANTTFALKAWYQYRAKKEISVKNGKADKKASDLLYKGKEDWEGIKTSTFFSNLMASVDPAFHPDVFNHGATVDMWVSRAMGYSSDTKGKAQYEFAENELAEVTDYLNRKDHGGKRVWALPHAQAALWTAIKARFDTISKELRKTSIEMGLMETVTKTIDGKVKKVTQVKKTEKDKDGNIIRSYKDEYGALMFKLLRERSEFVPESLPASGYSYRDALHERSLQISLEARPSTRSGILPNIHKAEYKEQAEHMAAQDTIVQQVLARLGLTGNVEVGVAGWEGDTTAGAQAFVLGDKFEGSLTDDMAQKADLASNIIGMIFHQDAVAWHSPIWNSGKNGQNGVEFVIGRPISEREARELYEKLSSVLGHQFSPPIPTKNGFRVLNFPDEKATLANKDKNLTAGEKRALQNSQLKKNKEFASLVEDAIIKSSVYDNIDHRQTRAFESEGNLVDGDWEKGTGYGDYRRRIEAQKESYDSQQEGSREGRSDLSKWITSLYSQVYETNKKYSKKYGWGNAGPTVRQFESATRFSISETAGSVQQADGRSSASQQSRGRIGLVLPIRADGRIVLKHYSREPRTILSTHFVGHGIEGSEKRKRMAYPDLYLNPIYTAMPNLYDMEKALRTMPWEHEISVNPDDLYDYGIDPLGFRERAAARVFEETGSRGQIVYIEMTANKMIYDAGYTGMYNTVSKGQQAMAVLWRSVTPEVATNRNTGEVRKLSDLSRIVPDSEAPRPVGSERVKSSPETFTTKEVPKLRDYLKNNGKEYLATYKLSNNSSSGASYYKANPSLIHALKELGYKKAFIGGEEIQTAGVKFSIGESTKEDSSSFGRMYYKYSSLPEGDSDFIYEHVLRQMGAYFGHVVAGMKKAYDVKVKAYSSGDGIGNIEVDMVVIDKKSGKSLAVVNRGMFAGEGGSLNIGAIKNITGGVSEFGEAHPDSVSTGVLSTLYDLEKTYIDTLGVMASGAFVSDISRNSYVKRHADNLEVDGNQYTVPQNKNIKYKDTFGMSELEAAFSEDYGEKAYAEIIIHLWGEPENSIGRAGTPYSESSRSSEKSWFDQRFGKDALEKMEAKPEPVSGNKGREVQEGSAGSTSKNEQITFGGMDWNDSPIKYSMSEEDKRDAFISMGNEVSEDGEISIGGKVIGNINSLTPWQSWQAWVQSRVINRVSRLIDGTRSLPQSIKYNSMRNKALGKVYNLEKHTEELFNSLKTASDAEAKAIFDYMTTKGALPNVLPEQYRDAAVKAKQEIMTIGRRLVAAGMMEEATLEKRDGEYLPRLYWKFLVGHNAKVAGSGKGQNLDYVKPRDEDIPPDVREFILGEIKNPAFLAAKAVAIPTRDLILNDLMEAISQNPAWVMAKSFINYTPKSKPVGRYRNFEYVKNDDGTYTVNKKTSSRITNSQKNVAFADLDSVVGPEAAAQIRANKGKPELIKKGEKYRISKFRRLGKYKWRRNADGTYNITWSESMKNEREYANMTEAELVQNFGDDIASAVVEGKGWVDGSVKRTPYALKVEAERLRKMAKHMPTEARAQTLEIARDMDEVADEHIKEVEKFDTKNWAQIPDSRRYGSLAGMVVRKEIFDDLVGNITFTLGDRNAADKILGETGYLRDVHGIWKWTKTAANPPSQVRNGIANLMMIHLSGVPMASIPKYLKLAMGEISAYRRFRKGKDVNPEQFKHLKLALDRGIGKSTFADAELRKVDTELIETLLNEKANGPMSAYLAAKKVFSEIYNATGDVYQYAETVGKLIIVIHAMTQRNMSADDAVIRANKWLFDYSQVTPAIKTMRTYPIGTPFITFALKVLPRMLEVLTTAPWRFAPYYLFIKALEASMQNLGADDDDLKGLKKSMPDFIREKAHAYFLPYKDNSGRLQLVDLGYLFPWTMWLESIQGMIQTATGDPLKGIPKIAAPLAIGGPLPDLIAAAKTGKDPFTGRDIVGALDVDQDEQVSAWCKYLWNLSAPPIFTAHGPMEKTAQAISGQVNLNEDPMTTPTQAMLRWFGINVYSYDPEITRYENMKQMTRKMNDLKYNLKRRIAEASANKSIAERDELMKEGERKLKKLSKELTEYQTEAVFSDSLKRKRKP